MDKYDRLLKEARERVHEYINLLCLEAEYTDSYEYENREIRISSIEAYLKKRGYTKNRLSNEDLYCKDFICVAVGKGGVEIFHDLPNSRRQFIKNSILTGLPIALNYMERI